MFHDNTFIKKIDANKLSRHVGVEAGHWIQHEKTEEVLELMKSFFAETAK